MTGPDEARDPHLREALRHAPDAQLQAPPQLSELILKEARAKARDPKPADNAAPRWARSVWDWLARPAVATGFAGVMAATLVGLMWWDQPMDEALPRSPVPAAAPTVAKPAAPEAPAVERKQPAPEAPAPSPKPEPEPKRKKSEAPSGAPGTSTAPTRSDAPAPRQERVERDTRDATAGAFGGSAEVARPAPPPAPAPMAAPAPAPAAAPPVVSADASADAALAQARAQEEEQKRERSSMAPAEALSRRATAKAQLNESRLQREGEAFTRVASVRAAIAADPSRWAWQRANGTTQAMGDAVYAWLAQLDSGTGTQWQPRAARETAAPRGRALALLRDGQVMHSFQLTERGVLWQRGQTAWQVELPAEALASLQAALDSIAP